MNALKDYVNWKLTHADKISVAEGYPLVMENCKKNKRMKQLELYGNSVQDGTPTPENPIEVQSVGELVNDEADGNFGKYKIPVVQRGINYHDYKKFNYKEQTINGITFTPLGDGSFHLKGKLEDTTKAASYRVVIWNAIPVKAGTYHSKIHSNADIIIMFGAYKKDSKFWLNINSSSNSGNGTLSEDGYIGYCQIYVKANTTREIDDIVYPQLTLGTEDLPYEPYIEPITTNVFLNEPLRKIGDYADYVDFANDKVFRVIKQEIMNGAESLLRMSGSYPYIAYNIGAVGYVVNGVCLSNQLQYQYGFSISREGVNAFSVLNAPTHKAARLVFRIYDNGIAIAEVSAIKSLLTEKYANGNPLIFYYGLSEATEEPITIDLPKLNAKTTIIEVDTSLAPSNAKGKYIKK